MAASLGSRDKDDPTQARWISHYHALMQREAVLITELQQQRANPLCGLREVWEEQSGAARSQQQLRGHLFGRVQGTRAKVQRLQQQLQDTRPGTSYIEALSSSIAEVESILQSIKTAQREAYGDLVAEEHRLESELEAAGAAFEDIESDDLGRGSAERAATAKRGVSCERPVHSARPPTAPAHDSNGTNSGSKSSSGLLPEVLEYDAYVARYGPCGGWHEDDHRVFTNCLRHCKGDYSHAVLVAAERLPCLTRPQLVAHARWHADLTDLDMRRRVAMVTWRANRDAAKAAAQAREDVVGEGAAAARQVQHEHLARDQATKSQRQQQRAALQEWRQQQEALAVAAAVQAQEQQRLHAEQEAADRAERQATNKAMLQQHKAAKAAAARQAAAATAALHVQESSGGLSGGRSSVSLQAQARVKERSEATVARRAALVSAKEAKQRARSEAQAALLAEASAPPAARDPARLLKATAAAAARAESTGGKGDRPAKESGFILHQQRVRATPVWMAPLLRQH